MADSFVQVADDGTGKKLQTVKATIGSDEVHAEAVFLVDPSDQSPITELPVDASGHAVPVTDNSGSLTVDGTVATNELPDTSSTYAPTNVTSSALEASHVIKGSPGVLFNVNGYNSKSSGQYIQLHNATSLPADTAVPVIIVRVAAQQNFSIDFGGKFGRYFSTGIVICNSSTADTKTLGSADCWFDAQFK